MQPHSPCPAAAATAACSPHRLLARRPLAMDAAAAGALRSVVHDCLAKHMYEAAAFFADKLVTASGYAPAEVYTLAQVGARLSE